jgi:hypothetical protein
MNGMTRGAARYHGQGDTDDDRHPGYIRVAHRAHWGRWIVTAFVLCAPPAWVRSTTRSVMKVALSVSVLALRPEKNTFGLSHPSLSSPRPPNRSVRVAGHGRCSRWDRW